MYSTCNVFNNDTDSVSSNYGRDWQTMAHGLDRPNTLFYTAGELRIRIDLTFLDGWKKSKEYFVKY